MENLLPHFGCLALYSNYSVFPFCFWDFAQCFNKWDLPGISVDFWVVRLFHSFASFEQFTVNLEKLGQLRYALSIE